jgi:hypothetical protein
MRYTYILTLALAAAACKQTSQAPVAKKAEAPEYFKANPGNAGLVRGEVRFEGPRPKAKAISMNAEEACEKLHTTPVIDSTVVVGKSGRLANVFVYIKSGLEGKAFEPSTEAVVLDQRGCMFVPRVLALRTGQTLAVKNSDPVSHNVHPRPENNREWNQQQPPGAPDLQRRFARPEVLIPVKCNIHAWMRAYIAVMEHPYFAVTNEAGTFSWPAVPPGPYTVAAWHESLGERTHSIKVGTGTEETVRFSFRAE